jgi:hypothetical protein
MTQLRTPHLLHVLPTFIPAGVGMRTASLIAGFGSEFRHSILSMDGRTDASGLLAEDAPVSILSSLPRAGSIATARRMRKLLLREAPDLVLTYNWGAFDMLLAARSLRFRRVVHHEDGFNAEAETFKRILARRRVLPGVLRMIVPSDRLFEIATRLWKVPAARIAVIGGGIDGIDAYREVYHSALCAGSEPVLPEAFDALC